MAKAQRTYKQQQALTHNGRGQMLEHSESYDDSLLPDSAELAKLKELDPNIIEWIKERTAKEQDFRHSFDDRKMNLVGRGTNMAFIIDIVTCTFALIIILASMYFSYFLIEKNQVLTGTIFAGGTILLTANAFLNFRKKFTDKSNGKK